MRISDWSSDVCSSDLRQFHGLRRRAQPDELEGVPLFDDARPHQGISHDRPPSVVRRAREILTCPPGRPPSRPPLRHRGAFRLPEGRSEEHTSELQSLMRISYAVFCLKKKKTKKAKNSRYPNSKPTAYKTTIQKYTNTYKT